VTRSAAETVYPVLPESFAHAMADEPILIDGMKVLFDLRVALYPVTVQPPDRSHPKNGGGSGAL
jgi:hypothetical protein